MLQDEEVIALFSSAAEKLGMEHGIEAVRIVRDPASNLGKGFGFVLFTSQPAARAALSLNNAQLRNRAIRVTKVGLLCIGATSDAHGASRRRMGCCFIHVAFVAIAILNRADSTLMSCQREATALCVASHCFRLCRWSRCLNISKAAWESQS